MTKKSCLRTLLIIAIGYFAFWYIGNWHYLKEKERSLIGTYQLDLNRTDMGIYKDSMDCFKDLKVEFRSDGTFKMNMEVPFILSSTGTWKVGGTLFAMIQQVWKTKFLNHILMKMIPYSILIRLHPKKANDIETVSMLFISKKSNNQNCIPMTSVGCSFCPIAC